MKKLMIIDDSETIRDFLRSAFEDMGTEVITATDGLDALEKIEDDIDLILCDWHMPRMNGLEFVRNARKKEELKYTPILMLTTENSIEQKQKAREAGATGWITKPITPEKLKKYISRLCI